MLDGLDSIPWNNLRHAYGSAEDVPGLLRALRTASPKLTGDYSPLWKLFGNIWHQGTVYEATAFAVPFLIEIASDPATPDRPGVLSLLAEIANGTSFRQVHGNLLGEADFQGKKAQELQWAKSAQEAVRRGFETFVEMTNEQSDVRHAAAHVLARLGIRQAEVSEILQGLLRRESRDQFRVGVFLLLGVLGIASDATVELLSNALKSDCRLQRIATLIAVRQLNLQSLPRFSQHSNLDACSIEELERGLQDLPWDAIGLVIAEEL